MKFWKNLSVAKKLYVVVGIMAILIATELFTLLFAMDTLSAVRSFVGGESLWSKAQKNAIYSLHRYVTTEDPVHFETFQEALEVSAGDRKARQELLKENGDERIIMDGFVQGQNHPDDVKRLVRLIHRFHSNRYVAKALDLWAQADVQFELLAKEANNIHRIISSRDPSKAEIETSLARVDRLNLQLTELEKDFSQILGEGSRWMERALMYLLVLAVLTVEATGLTLAFTFSRNLNRSLTELSLTAQEVGRGNFTHMAPVRSSDELGQLAEAINKMTKDLRTSIGQRVRAENANQVKTLFLANMSHEIRTPLGVILGLVDILKDPNLPWKEHTKYIETIEKTGNSLNRIINDILDISKVETGHLEIEKTNFGLDEFLHDIQTTMKVKANKNHNEIRLVKQGELPEKVATDRIRLRQILVNLINNALKFTQNGSVVITYGAKDHQIYFQIADTGAGISPENQEKLFNSYFRGDENLSSIEGTGLGLVLSKRLAQALGGDVVLRSSVPGQGSVFVATIKNETIEESKKINEAVPMQTAQASNILNGKKVLVVEDVIDNQMLTKLYLARKGMKVQFANNGAEGVQKALAEEFDLILMDMQMPVMDGYTATRTLRDQGYQRPIIALTAHAMKEDRERCLQAGCDDYLTKPLDSNALYGAITKNLEDQMMASGNSSNSQLSH
jgi:hypothetical protein